MQFNFKCVDLWNIDSSLFEYILEKDGLENATDYLLEDILMFSFRGSKYIIDLGFFPESDVVNGEFKLTLVEEENWSNPLEEFKSKDLKKVRQKIQEFVLIVERLEGFQDSR